MYESSSKELNGCVSNLLAHEDLGQFEEAHHWNIQDKFYNEKFPPVYESDKIGDHYCRMLLTRHYDQRPFDETVCDAIIANGDVKNPYKKMQNVCDDGSIKHGSEFSCVCDEGHIVQFNELFAMRQKNRNGQPDEGVCDI